ncbi:MAG: c-type cytochrome [Gammaproteobacteria bacterium]
MKTVMILFCSILIFALTASAQAGDAAAGKTKSILCVTCHGAEGISNNDVWPNLAGQKEGYLIKQIRNFRDGVRNNPMMTPLVSSLSDQDIADLAAYFSRL